jgi:uncharacterized PurR-regulated membrane protein YhhQ (DUF165 family)
MIKKIFIGFVIISIVMALLAPIVCFNKEFSEYNALHIYSLLSFVIVCAGCCGYLLSEIVVRIFFK